MGYFLGDPTGSSGGQGEGLLAPEVVVATAAYRAEQDHLGQWLEQECEVGLDPDVRTGATALSVAFGAWLKLRGEEPVSHRVFGERMRAKGFLPYKSNTYYYLGMRFANERRNY